MIKTIGLEEGVLIGNSSDLEDLKDLHTEEGYYKLFKNEVEIYSDDDRQMVIEHAKKILFKSCSDQIEFMSAWERLEYTDKCVFGNDEILDIR